MPQTFYVIGTGCAPCPETAVERNIDARVTETLTVMFRFGMFDRTKTIRPANVARGNAAAQKIAEEGAVLLRNMNSALPLDATTVTYRRFRHPG